MTRRRDEQTARPRAGAAAMPRRARDTLFLAAILLFLRPGLPDAIAGALAVPNGSFEAPWTDYANPDMDEWEKAPKPGVFSEFGGFLWNQLMGQFQNPAVGQPDRIDNADGSQLAWLFAVGSVAIFQDYNTIGSTSTAPTHHFNATYDVGKSYTLTVGVIGGGGRMSPGATLEIALYYRDGANNMVTVGRTVVTNSTSLFPTTTHLVDFQASVPQVRSNHAWAGKNIGIRIASTVTEALEGGYWDIDNVRLRSYEHPQVTGVTATNGQFRFTLQGEPGAYQVLASTNVAAPLAQWTAIATVTNVSGVLPVLHTNVAPGSRFFTVRPPP